MANTATLVSSSANHITYRLDGDGTVVGPTIANATLLADMKPGPLRDSWNKVLTTQAAMRIALLGGGDDCRASIQLVATGVDVTAQVDQVVADVVTITKAEINIGMSDTTGQIAYLTLEKYHSMTR